MNLRHIVIGIGIFILTLFVTIYGISVFFPQPQYEDFCGSERFPKMVNGEEQICPSICVELYEIQDGECIFNECGSGCGPDAVTSFDKLNQCEIALTGKNCYDLYNDAMEENSKKRFLASIPLGVIVIILGNVIFALESVGVGLMAGGVGTFIWGAGGYWSYASDLWRFAISLLGLVVLILAAYWFEKQNKTGFFKRIFGKK